MEPNAPKVHDAIPLGKIISENYCDFERPVHMKPRESGARHLLLDMLDGANRNYDQDDMKDLSIHKVATANYPSLLGRIAAGMISDGSKVLVVNGGLGRCTYEITRSCQKCVVDFTDPSAEKIQIVTGLYQTGVLRWNQQVEGDIVEEREHQLTADDIGQINENANDLRPKPVADYKAAGDALDSDYDFIVADFRYYKPPLAEISARLKPDGILLVATMEENGGLDAETAKAFDRTKLALADNISCWYSAKEDNGANSLFPHIMAVAHFFQETINKHEFMVSNVSAWRKSGDVSGGSKEVGKEADYNVHQDDLYKDKGVLEAYDKFHFGPGLLAQECFPVAIAQVCIAACKKVGVTFDAAIDAGGGPGRSAFEFVK